MDGEMHGQMSELKDDFAKLRGDLSGIVRTLMDATKAEAGEARDRLEAKAHEQIDALARGLNRGKETGRHCAHVVCEQIEENPMASVLTALGVGFLIGILIHRK